MRMDWMWLALMVLPTIALMAIAEDMARVRGRSVRTWVWITALTGPLPLGPLVLYLLGPRTERSVC
jgi:FtsH-binding integral membrane protein